MKLRIPNDILAVDFLTLLLILSIILIPSTPVRVILGLPFLLFFPGYTLVVALFKGHEMDGIERVALSVGMSIAVVGLIGFGLNYTPWGIRLEPVLFFVVAFISVMSAIAMIRRGRAPITTELSLKLPGWEGGGFNKSLSIVLFIAVLAALGTLVYAIAAPKTGERFTEFYILGINGKAQDYPARFTMNNGEVMGVVYGDNASRTDASLGTVTIGIVNHEQQTVIYSVKMTIKEEPADIEFGGESVGFLGDIELPQGAKWENGIPFAPRTTGDNQKVEFLLFKGNETVPAQSLHLWIDVVQTE